MQAKLSSLLAHSAMWDEGRVRRSLLEQVALLPLSRYWTRKRRAKFPTLSGFETQFFSQPARSLDTILTQLLGN